VLPFYSKQGSIANRPRFSQPVQPSVAPRPAPTGSLVRVSTCSYSGLMDKATVSRLKNNLSAYLRKVRAGQTVVIYDRDVPIARLERIEAAGSGADRLALLRAQGVTRPPLRPLSSARLRAALATALPAHARLLEALREQRAEDR